jgi:hypothetical protein
MKEWWKRIKADLGKYTKDEIEDLTGCIPLLLKSCIVDGKFNLEVGEMKQVWDDVAKFAVKIAERNNSDRDQYMYLPLNFRTATNFYRYCNYQIETAVPRSNPREDGDILYIFDACSAGVAGVYWRLVDGMRYVAGSSLAKSFTQTLTSKLRELGGMPRTVARVSTEIFCDADANEMPVHIPHTKKPSITISQLPLPQGPKPEPFSKRLKDFVDNPIPQHRVLIGVNLKDRLPYIQE